MMALCAYKLPLACSYLIMKYLLFFLLGGLTSALIFLTDWWLPVLPVLWAVILYRLCLASKRLYEKIDHRPQHAHRRTIQKLEP